MSKGSLAEEFIFPPFTVLNARTGDWQKRKAAWINLGIESELGRDVISCERTGHTCATEKLMDIKGGFGNQSLRAGASVFDPVLTELLLTWFCPRGGAVLDPFAGGSVRGVVAALLGLKYVGIDLSQHQIEANEAQWSTISASNYINNILGRCLCQKPIKPQWICGDAEDSRVLLSEKVDFIFTCPPYGNLERYTDDPRDLSSMNKSSFFDAYRSIIADTISLLRDDRFACFVVGDLRDSRGNYWNLPGQTIAAFEETGACLYNEAVLVTQVGSLPIRVGKQFRTSRKLGKTHQNVLIFLKGDAKKAAQVSI
ncbi:MAG: DNA methyltransferase [Desulfomonile tiedjei]|nr:DNA methyltransferase [Desulfomonile tiedjei]